MPLYRSKRTRRKKKKNSKALPQLTKTQKKLMLQAYDETVIDISEWHVKTIKSLITRGYIRHDYESGKMVISRDGETYVKKYKSSEKERRALEIKFERAWVKFGNPTISLVADKGLDRDPVMILGDTRRFDFVFPEYQIAIEVQGGTYSGGAHTRGQGYDRDVKKKRDALALGWYTIELTSTDLVKKQQKKTVDMVMSILSSRVNHPPTGLLLGTTMVTVGYHHVSVDDQSLCITLTDMNNSDSLWLYKGNPLFKPVLKTVLTSWSRTDTYMNLWTYKRCDTVRDGQVEEFADFFGDVI